MFNVVMIRPPKISLGALQFVSKFLCVYKTESKRKTRPVLSSVICYFILYRKIYFKYMYTNKIFFLDNLQQIFTTNSSLVKGLHQNTFRFLVYIWRSFINN